MLEKKKKQIRRNISLQLKKKKTIFLHAIWIARKEQHN